MNLNNIVWTAVVAVVLVISSAVSAFSDSPLGDALAISFGLGSITFAILSGRDRR